MRSPIAQYLNEIVSLTIMALMCLALVAGQVEAEPGQTANDSREPGTTQLVQIRPQGASAGDRLVVIDLPKLSVGISFRFRHTGE